ncbi:MAG TPA: M20/M25/M40 family metallo-hydrolase, partial [Pyrinomonadaceae bacterium]|nr:M20/M25/M40 family metallo-hydrolase [Pyrinomonadaceae bacterium]
GYGIVSPDLKRDDYANLDVKGKIVVVVRGRPQSIDEETWAKSAGQRAIFTNAVGRGAAGLVFTNVGSKEQPFTTVADYLSRRNVALSDAPEPPFKVPPIILLSDAGAEKLFADSGQTFAETLAKAQTGEFVSRDLNKTGTIAIRLKREESTGSNVVGVLEGSDSQLKSEAVLYSAHYDAYGITADGRIYPGAADNALGVAEILAIAEAFTKARPRPKRSIIFLAVTGEEYGLYGSEYWAEHPTWPLDKVIANLNYDGIGTEVYGPVKNIVGFGAEYSDLGPRLESVAAALGAKIVPDPLPEEKVFYRSDHYSFVKKGVPALMLLGGPEGDAQTWIGRAQKWMEVDYHQTTDTIKPDWNWDGARTVANIGLVLGMRLAADRQVPAWLPSAPFKRPPPATTTGGGAAAQPAP